MTISSINNDEIIIGLIHSVNCGYCIELMPEWLKMKKNIQKKYEKNMPFFLEFEAKDLKKLEEYNEKNKTKMNGAQIEYTGFPTIFKISNGNIEYYKGERNAKIMEDWFLPVNNKSIQHIKGGKNNKTQKRKKYDKWERKTKIKKRKQEKSKRQETKKTRKTK